MNAMLTHLDRLSASLVPGLLQLSLEIAVLVVVVALTIHLLRIQSPTARHLLWLLVPIKPIVWLCLSSPWTLLSVLPSQASLPTQASAPGLSSSFSLQRLDQNSVDLQPTRLTTAPPGRHL